MNRLAMVAGLLAVVGSACGSAPRATTASSTTVPVPSDDPAETSSGTPATNPPAASTTSPAQTTTTSPAQTTTTSPPRTTTSPPDGDLTAVQVRLDDVAVLDRPIDTTVLADGTLWVAQRNGLVVTLDHLTGEVGTTVVDLTAETTTDGERGLLGLANDGEFLYVNFTDRGGHTTIDAFALEGRGVGTRHHLLTIEQPFGNHNGGALAIGPDGHLYIGVGDGGGGGDPLGAGQDPAQLLGSILRITPTPGGASPYAIPPGNPFADGTAGLPEIFAIGVRNPWRISFDDGTGDFWVADVGQDAWEEVDLLPAATGGGSGANLGWNLREGTRQFRGDRPAGNVDPVFEYPHQDGTPSGCGVSGGRVYRGSAIPELVGSYVFGDWCAESLWAISVAVDGVVFRDLETPITRLVGVGVDPDGELLALSLDGRVSRLVGR